MPSLTFPLNPTTNQTFTSGVSSWIYNGTSWESLGTSITGNTGADGAPGVGVAPAGTTGQILAKTSNSDYATGWIDAPTGGGGDVAEVVLTESTTIGTGQANKVILKALDEGSITKPGYLDERGKYTVLDNLNINNTVSATFTNPSTTNITYKNAPVINSIGTGTATITDVSTSNTYSRIPKLEYLVETLSTNGVAGFRDSVNTRGISNQRTVIIAGQSLGGSAAERRCFIGLGFSTSTQTDVDPATMTNSIGVFYNSSSPYLQILCSGNAVFQVIPTTISKPYSNREQIYIVTLDFFNNTIRVKVQSMMGSGESFSHTFTTINSLNTPVGAVLNACGWCSCGGTNTDIGMGLVSITTERYNPDYR